jgi:hypothetical protein
MASPRVFISSTCYDLQEIRYHLRKFIEDFGFEAVMSEFGDIFYNFDKHVQDACKEEIEKCNLFILVIGNNYGSLYYNNNDELEIPDSVTLQEFRKALSTNKPKHIFINKFVNHDFQNYRKSLEKTLLQFFKSNNIEQDKIDAVRKRETEKFNAIYHYPQESYKFIFNFLEIISNLTTNNAQITFETFDDIKNSLRKQWGGLVYDALSKPNNISADIVKEIGQKLEKIEQQIKALVSSRNETGTNDKTISFDITKIVNQLSIDDLIEVQKNLLNSLEDIMFEDKRNRIKFREKWKAKSVLTWLESLEAIVNDYKWSATVDLENVFHYKIVKIDYVFYPRRKEVPYPAILKLYTIFKGIPESEKTSFCNTILNFFNNKCFEEKKQEPDTTPDGLPF